MRFAVRKGSSALMAGATPEPEARSGNKTPTLLEKRVSCWRGRIKW